ncbi:MAG: HAD family hydrolase [Bacillota bacterium]|jgi:HAD superfamily hydrolase (TIGR01549 family)
MVKAIFFDMDGTLLPLDFHLFFQKYMQLITPYFKDIVDPQIFYHHLMLSTEEMIKNSGARTNEIVFMEKFLPGIEQKEEIVYPLLEKFYREEFVKLKEHVGYSHLAAQIVEAAVDKGYSIILATNPVFPRLAIRHRMSWAGIDQFPWLFVTSYENCCTCKPNPEYYREICTRLQIQPEECLMVGNDVQEDLVAGTIGMKTFLVTDYLIDRGRPQYIPNYKGNLKELHWFMHALPSA